MKGRGRKMQPVMGAVLQKPRKTGPSTLECRLCFKAFKKRFNFETHFRTHTGERPFQCDLCGRLFSQKSNMKAHKESHKKWPKGMDAALPPTPLRSVLVVAAGKIPKTETMVMKDFLCPYCNEEFKNFASLRAHIPFSHQDEKMFACPQLDCKEFFKNEADLQKHKQEHPNFSYRCTFCNHFCESLKEVKKHEVQHTGYPQEEKRLQVEYPCNRCTKVFRKPESLKHHILTTSHEFPCSRCDVVCTSEAELRKHIVTHGTIKQFSCIICKKEFRTKTAVKNHMVIHGSRKFTCSRCSAQFFSKYNLERHFKIHERRPNTSEGRRPRTFHGHCVTAEGHYADPDQCCKNKKKSETG